MLSRESLVQVGVVIVALGVFLLVPTILDVPFDSAAGVVASVLFNAILVGGAHLYFALRGENDEQFPVVARWRTVLLVATLAVVALAGYAFLELTTFSEQVIETGAVGAAVVVVLVYWYLEARDGYRSSRPS